MEPTPTKVILGEFEVVQVSLAGTAITIDLGKRVHVTIHVGDFPHKIKEGDFLPLFTEIGYAKSGSTPEQ